MQTCEVSKHTPFGRRQQRNATSIHLSTIDSGLSAASMQCEYSSHIPDSLLHFNFCFVFEFDWWLCHAHTRIKLLSTFFSIRFLKQMNDECSNHRKEFLVKVKVWQNYGNGKIQFVADDDQQNVQCEMKWCATTQRNPRAVVDARDPFIAVLRHSVNLSVQCMSIW